MKKSESGKKEEKNSIVTVCMWLATLEILL